VDPLSQLTAVLIVPLFTRRTLMVFGCIGIGIINVLIGYFDTADNNLIILILVLSLIVMTSIFQEPVFQMYTTEIGNDSSLAICSSIFFGTQAITSQLLPYIVRKLGPCTLYYSCGVVTICGTIFMFFFVKETAHLTDKEKKMIY